MRRMKAAYQEHLETIFAFLSSSLKPGQEIDKLWLPIDF